MTRAAAPAPARDYAGAVEYITGLVRAEPTPDDLREKIGLSPIESLLAALGDPHADLACIHIAGSKGKGSTALLTERVLRAGGVRTGTFTSPHLVEWSERIRVDGSPVPEHSFADAVHAVSDAAARSAGPEPSFFDVLTAAAMLVFRDAGVEAVVLETGLGGRLDATNVVRAPLATCITTIELEHAERLGGTLAAIAREKAGILKPGAPLVLGRLRDAARRIVLERAQALGAPVWSLDERATFTRRDAGGWRIALALEAGDVELDVDHPSAAIADDAALAAACVAATGRLDGDGFASATRALAGCRVPGRLDILGREPLRIVDGAHTTQSVACLVDMLDALAAPSLRLVVSVTGGRDPRELLAPLLARAERVYVTSAEVTRSLPASELAAALAGLPGSERMVTLADPHEALLTALRETPAHGALCATGSLYLAGAALELLDGA